MRSRAVTAAHEDKILDALKAAPKDGMSGVELAKTTGLWSEPLYGARAQMEHDGRVRTLRQTVLQPILLTLGKHANDINDSG
jgi:hypothetical protein